MPSLLGFLPIGLLSLPFLSPVLEACPHLTCSLPALGTVVRQLALPRESVLEQLSHPSALVVSPGCLVDPPACARLCSSVLSLTFCLYHLSDYTKGFGGKYGVQKDRMDKVRPGGVVGMFFRGPLAHNTGGLTLGICRSMVLGALHTSCSTLCVCFVSPLGL